MPYYGPNDSIRVAVSYNQNMVVNTAAGNAWIVLANSTGGLANAYYSEGNGTNVLVFTANAGAHTTGNGEITIANLYNSDSNNSLIHSNGATINSLYESTTTLFNALLNMGLGENFWLNLLYGNGSVLFSGNSFTSNLAIHGFGGAWV